MNIFHIQKIAFLSALCVAFLITFSFAACGDDDDDSNDDSDQADDDLDDDVNDDTDDDSDDDVDDDSDDDTQPECDPDEMKCDEQALNILLCSLDGRWEISEKCMEDQGRLCENAACVDHWLYGSPEFESCENDPNATALNLAQKAAWYDEVSSRFHIHPGDKRIHNVTVPGDVT